VSAADPHPADQLIRELIASGRAAAPDEIAQILQRMATAPFTSRIVRVPTRERGAAYQGHTLLARAPSLVYHLVKRVAIEEQWASGTTQSEYLSDLGRGIRELSSRLAVYTRRGDHVAAVVSATNLVVPAVRRGADSLPQLLVVYSANSGMIVTGYQFSTLEQTGIPWEALWLK
jgi:hypothetical protein